MMNSEYKEKWISALESGKYPQGKGRLRNKADMFCCLGVLCDVVDSSKWSNHTIEGMDGYTYIENGSSLPIELRTRLNISLVQQDTLVRLNDTGSSFIEIVKWIQRNL